ncbi:S8 family serine peptidase [Methylobacterium trifolii]|uniref:S8 family serine peptidase n=1 Tax=Methylobacterium trifolii TaxID=1003092 RepID=UPI001EDCAFFC|nr:S8 family serine peptidase [Methylobacterium trifolii]
MAKELFSVPGVEAAYVKPPAEPPMLNDMAPTLAEPPGATPDYRPRQVYLKPAPEGVDAVFAWEQPGGRGEGVTIYDVEGGWCFEHEDLVRNSLGLGGGIVSADMGWRNHGTAVMGVFGGDQEGRGITGICPDAKVGAVAIFEIGSAAAIRAAADKLRPGDILLIELHRPGPRNDYQGRQDQDGYVAVEWWPDDYDAIRYAVGRGVIVVEAAGNGAQDLDDPIYDQPAPGFPRDWINPYSRKGRDSGAIVVGAGAPPPGTHGSDHGPDRSRLEFSNYGALVDVQGWGREVTTCGYGDLQSGREEAWYTDRFSGTSSASPIVVGALGAVQGILRSRKLPLLTPARARALLRNTGSDQTDGPDRPQSQRIGRRPDIRAMVEAATARDQS